MAKITDCSVCLETFVRPKMLPCQHTYCLKCLQRLSNSEMVKCPQCRVSYEIPSNEVDAFPNNLLMMSLLNSPVIDKVPNPAQMTMPCKECKSGRSIDENCEHCDRYLCEVCRRGHIQEVIRKMKSDMKTLEQDAFTFNKQIVARKERVDKAISLKKQINEWQESCVKEAASRANQFIAEVYYKLELGKPFHAQDMATEIKAFRENFIIKIEKSTQMSEVLRDEEKLKNLKERSRALAIAIKEDKKSPPRLKFEEEKAQRLKRTISQFQGVGVY